MNRLKFKITATTFLSDFSNAAIIFTFSLALIGKSAFWFSLLYGVYYFSSFIIHLIMGMFIDKKSPASLMIFSEIARFVLLLLAFVIVSMGSNQKEIYLFIICLIGLVEPIFHPAEMKVIFHYFSGRELSKIDSILELSDQSMMIFAPILITLIYKFKNIQGALLIILIILIISIIINFLLNKVTKIDIKTGNSDRDSFKELLSGYAYIVNKRKLLYSSSILGIVNIAFGIVTPLILPLLQVYKADATLLYLFVTTAESTGVIFGALFILTFNKTKRITNQYYPFLFISSSFLIVGMAQKSPVLIIICYFIIGGATSYFNVLNNLQFQKSSEEKMIGKVFAFKGMITVLGFTVGSLIGGFIITIVAVNTLFIAVGFVTLSFTLLILFLKKNKKF
ncbi:MAG TPA: MFS transporter [Lactovum miscens]|uniref:MFS transporter n=1 Tax=Lactovum miscens TaxID=190387 RepID=UPI002EDB080E